MAGGSESSRSRQKEKHSIKKKKKDPKKSKEPREPRSKKPKPNADGKPVPLSGDRGRELSPRTTDRRHGVDKVDDTPSVPDSSHARRSRRRPNPLATCVDPDASGSGQIDSAPTAADAQPPLRRNSSLLSPSPSLHRRGSVMLVHGGGLRGRSADAEAIRHYGSWRSLDCDRAASAGTDAMEAASAEATATHVPVRPELISRLLWDPLVDGPSLPIRYKTWRDGLAEVALVPEDSAIGLYVLDLERGILAFLRPAFSNSGSVLQQGGSVGSAIARATASAGVGSASSKHSKSVAPKPPPPTPSASLDALDVYLVASSASERPGVLLDDSEEEVSSAFDGPGTIDPPDGMDMGARVGSAESSARLLDAVALFYGAFCDLFQLRAIAVSKGRAQQLWCSREIESAAASMAPPAPRMSVLGVPMRSSARSLSSAAPFGVCDLGYNEDILRGFQRVLDVLDYSPLWTAARQAGWPSMDVDKTVRELRVLVLLDLARSHLLMDDLVLAVTTLSYALEHIPDHSKTLWLLVECLHYAVPRYLSHCLAQEDTSVDAAGALVRALVRIPAYTVMSDRVVLSSLEVVQKTGNSVSMRTAMMGWVVRRLQYFQSVGVLGDRSLTLNLYSALTVLMADSDPDLSRASWLALRTLGDRTLRLYDAATPDDVVQLQVVSALLDERSEYFHRMLVSNMAESVPGAVIVIPTEFPHLFELLVQYYYCARCSVDDSNALALLLLANQFAADELALQVEKFLISRLPTLDFDEVVQVAESAESVNAMRLLIAVRATLSGIFFHAVQTNNVSRASQVLKLFPHLRGELLTSSRCLCFALHHGFRDLALLLLKYRIEVNDVLPSVELVPYGRLRSAAPRSPPVGNMDAEHSDLEVYYGDVVVPTGDDLPFLDGAQSNFAHAAPAQVSSFPAQPGIASSSAIGAAVSAPVPAPHVGSVSIVSVPPPSASPDMLHSPRAPSPSSPSGMAVHVDASLALVPLDGELVIAQGGSAVHPGTVPGRVYLRAWEPPLIVAVRRGYDDIVTDILDRGADVNCEGHDGETPLDVAVVAKRLDVALVLIKRGGDVNRRRSDSLARKRRKQLPVITPDMYVVQIDLPRYSPAADIRTTLAKDSTPLMLAAYYGTVELAEKLVASGARIDVATMNRNTALHVAACVGNREVVYRLIDLGADVNCINIFGWKALHFAAHFGFVDILVKLLHSGSTDSPAILATDKQSLVTTRRTAQEIALEEGHDEVQEIFKLHVSRIPKFINDQERRSKKLERKRDASSSNPPPVIGAMDEGMDGAASSSSASGATTDLTQSGSGTPSGTFQTAAVSVPDLMGPAGDADA
jgi:ankyrin repeat protein